jgi:hypothetical protein
MHTDADGNIIFHTARGKFYYGMLVTFIVMCSALPSVGGIYIFLGKGFGWPLVLIGMIFLIPLYLFLLTGRIKFVLEDEGIRISRSIRAGGLVKVWPKFIPYHTIFKFYETRRVDPGAFTASFDLVVIRFTTDSGRKDAVALSPENREDFISKLTKRTGVQLSMDPDKKKE